jgi:hypothetical protein
MPAVMRTTASGVGRTKVRWPCLASTVALLGCVPEGPATDAEPSAPRSENIGLVPLKKGPTDPLLTTTFRDDFERDTLGDAWRALSDAWAIHDGELCVSGAKNRGVWLARRLSDNAVIRFDARADSLEGDIKAEVWGDGVSGASGSSYDDATSYVLVFGGWNNSRHVLARLDEHGDDALSITLSPEAEAPQQRPVAQGQRYAFRIERSDKSTIRWFVDDLLIHQRSDTEPLEGPDHDHFGFNGWMAPVCFDNVEIAPL